MDLQWSQVREDHLVTWNQDICLWQTEDVESGHGKIKQGCMRLSQSKAAAIIAKIGDYPYLKVVDVYPGTDAEGLIAVGTLNGKVAVTSFGSSISSGNREFSASKHSRSVLSVQWNRSLPNLLAAGFEKTRAEYGIAIWDITTGSKFVNGLHTDNARPVTELGVTETAHSVAWVQTKSILAGMNGKHIKLFDLRDSQAKLGSTASTKAVYGICIDELCTHRVASFADSQVYVWDMRNFEKPFVVLNHSKPITKVGWCPTRPGLLVCLERDTSYLTIHDVNHAALSTEEGEPAVLERRLSPAYSDDVQLNTYNPPNLNSFAWHPTQENLITTIAGLGGIMWNSVVFERITLNWSSTSKLGWSDGKLVIQYIDSTDDVYASLDDISLKMKQRALNGYGLKTVLKDNCQMVEDENILKNLWEWLDYSKTLTESEKYRVPSIGSLKFPGARTVLRIDTTEGATGGPMKSEVIHNNCFDLHNNKTYRSEERTFVQQLCGWNTENLNETQGSPTRRAAIALFHLKLRQSIKILNESPQTVAYAMAIAGFTNDKSSLWRELALANCNQLNDPYIRAIFAFLTESESKYDTILSETQLSVADRLGFACSFLPDSKLIAFVQDLTNEMVKKGNLQAILLTGMTKQAIPLLQRYLDNTGDIQTVALVVIRTMATDISPNLKVSCVLRLWTERYREVLDAWKLWEQRAEFDILKNSNNSALVPKAEVNISCNFCGKSISTSGTTSLARTANLFQRYPANAAKLKNSCCPSCRKPLPRCSICLMHMGTVLGSAREVQPAVVPFAPGSSYEAFSWCQTCRHGGHTVHLQLWFQKQPECPVSGCTCKCFSLDRVMDFALNIQEIDS